MAAFADTFKAEVARIARKEGKDDLTQLRKTVATQRSEIAGLKKELKALASQVKDDVQSACSASSNPCSSRSSTITPGRSEVCLPA